METILYTMLKRPYVVAFLAAYLVLGYRYFGGWRTGLWLVIGYGVAWLSEWSSIHTGFPYGLYHYIYENLHGELMLAGVPVWDSLSYVFLIFAGYTTAAFIQFPKSPHPLLGALLTMLLDVIIDPLAHLGNRWFLGEIYYYASPGIYFNVPLSNFFGWFLVAFLVIALFQALARPPLLPRPFWLYPAFYISIALFNILLTFAIQEWALAFASLGWLSLVVMAVVYRDRYGLTSV